MKKSNKLARFFFITGVIIMILGILLFLVQVYEFSREGVYLGGFLYVIMYLAPILQIPTFGILLVALAEVIELLEKLLKKPFPIQYVQTANHPSVTLENTRTSAPASSATPTPPRERKPYNPDAVPQETRTYIMDYFTRQGINALRFYQTPFNNIVFVELENEEFRAVIVDPFGVNKELPKHAWGDELKKWLEQEGLMA